MAIESVGIFAFSYIAFRDQNSRAKLRRPAKCSRFYYSPRLTRARL